uniref:Uncharacterized protein n=1 Tax=Ulva partita TaxID=1605170 RepID=A0A1C9ZWF0_9CHLO|nr:hypothetical protein [Ulva partita]
MKQPCTVRSNAGTSGKLWPYDLHQDTRPRRRAARGSSHCTPHRSVPHPPTAPTLL